MNRVLGRGTDLHPDRREVGTLLDVPPASQWYDDLAEAIIPHRYRKDKKTGVEHWVSSEPLPLREPGFFFSGVRLHCINDDYTPAVNGRFHGLDFNRSGEITCGDEELDRALLAILEETIDPATMTQEEMLRAVYDYVVHNFSYAYGNMYDRGAQGWEIREAKRMLRNGAGNCYCFASLFYELARFVGYDAQIYAGFAYGEQYDYYDDDQVRVVAPQGYTPHGRVEIEIDGKNELFDPEYEYRSFGLMQMFKAEPWIYLAYGYTK
jgi:transglutaminase-like putative cysteine protease